MEMKEKILTCAQRLIQQRGFNGFSYADIAKEVGVRKASLHHHFPTKTKLGLSLIEVYTTQYEALLIRIGDMPISADEKLARYIDIYRGSLAAERMCLCGMLASESLTLDAEMLPSLNHFFVVGSKWLTELLKEGESEQVFNLTAPAEDQAHMLSHALQGALMISRASNNAELFEQTASSLISNLMRKG